MREINRDIQETGLPEPGRLRAVQRGISNDLQGLIMAATPEASAGGGSTGA
jgi:hypothetical protein